jgi:hypothetical protein
MRGRESRVIAEWVAATPTERHDEYWARRTTHHSPAPRSGSAGVAPTHLVSARPSGRQPPAGDVGGTGEAACSVPGEPPEPGVASAVTTSSTVARADRPTPMIVADAYPVHSP